MVNGDVLERAVHFAVDAHRGAVRKLSEAPYILHPLEALCVAGTFTRNREVLAATVLHDTVEDAGVSPEELEERFGPRVAALVACETEDKRPDIPASETWDIRKEESLERLRASNDPDARILWLADKLSNLRSIRAVWLREGHTVWKRCNQRDPARQAWYYRSIRDALSPLREFPAWREYARLVDEIFSDIPDGIEQGGNDA